jgi:fructokinase
MALYGGIEGGGTKFVCVVASGPEDIRLETRFPTTTPDETIGRAIQFFKDASKQEPLAAIGVASFGPVDLDPASATYGYITTTPKPGWAWTDFLGQVKNAFNVPCAFETDVNAAAMGEYRWGASRGMDPSIYFTIGTGIGAGVIVHGAPVHGLVHPETGHIAMRHDLEKDPFPGNCPFHGDCFEGLAAGPAMQARWGVRAEMLPPDHPAWDLEASYIAAAMVTQICSLSPKKIILGGGVMQQPALFPLIWKKVPAMLNGYVQSKAITENIDSYIVPPGLGGRSGVLGAIGLAMSAVGK